MRVALMFDGASHGNPGHAGAGYHILADGKPFLQGGRPLGIASNNVAEYTGLIAGLEALQEFQVTDLLVLGDSQLVVRQVLGEYRVKNPVLQGLHERVIELLSRFRSWSIHWVPREDNAEADAMSSRAARASAAGSRTNFVARGVLP